MKKNSMNKKGFTLIELLAVIVIMGVLMVAAIPAISNAIANSRRNTFVSNAKQLISAVRTSMADVNEIESDGSVSGTTKHNACRYPGPQQYTIVNIKVNDIGYLLERGGNQSSFGQPYKDAYVIVANAASAGSENNKFVYYVSLVDAGANGIFEQTEEGVLKRGSVVMSKPLPTGTQPSAATTVSGYSTQADSCNVIQ